MPDSTPDAATTVTTLLAVAGISPTPDEVAFYVDGYPALRASLDTLYAIDGVRYEEPGLVFSAIPQI
jgi:hypothetical protein